jgi:hypothetical protein
MKRRAGENSFMATTPPEQANVVNKLSVPNGEFFRQEVLTGRFAWITQGEITPANKSKFDDALIAFLGKSGKTMVQSDLQQNIDGRIFTLWDLHAQVLQHGASGNVSR